MEITLDVKQVEQLEKLIDEAGTDAGRIIDDVLAKTGFKLISEKIVTLLPRSGRDWNGKPTAAANTMPFQAKKTEPLSITVMSKPKYDYLYFPDDGSNTRRHVGNQHFMQRGAEAVTGEIIDACLKALTDKINNT